MSGHEMEEAALGNASAKRGAERLHDTPDAPSALNSPSRIKSHRARTDGDKPESEVDGLMSEAPGADDAPAAARDDQGADSAAPMEALQSTDLSDRKAALVLLKSLKDKAASGDVRLFSQEDCLEALGGDEDLVKRALKTMKEVAKSHQRVDVLDAVFVRKKEERTVNFAPNIQASNINGLNSLSTAAFRDLKTYVREEALLYFSPEDVEAFVKDASPADLVMLYRHAVHLRKLRPDGILSRDLFGRDPPLLTHKTAMLKALYDRLAARPKPIFTRGRHEEKKPRVAVDLLGFEEQDFVEEADGQKRILRLFSEFAPYQYAHHLKEKLEDEMAKDPAYFVDTVRAFAALYTAFARMDLPAHLLDQIDQLAAVPEYYLKQRILGERPEDKTGEQWQRECAQRFCDIVDTSLRAVGFTNGDLPWVYLPEKEMVVHIFGAGSIHNPVGEYDTFTFFSSKAPSIIASVLKYGKQVGPNLFKWRGYQGEGLAGDYSVVQIYPLRVCQVHFMRNYVHANTEFLYGAIMILLPGGSRSLVENCRDRFLMGNFKGKDYQSREDGAAYKRPKGPWLSDDLIRRYNVGCAMVDALEEGLLGDPEQTLAIFIGIVERLAPELLDDVQMIGLEHVDQEDVEE
ncbi:hypothetical protein DFJ74DRAFT_767298 [Hyaloraphidium curvatum]|nr:hypothetical protein DFJ74DRAFT_767298 [Hyaloraphidium curvatum]